MSESSWSMLFETESIDHNIDVETKNIDSNIDVETQNVDIDVETDNADPNWCWLKGNLLKKILIDVDWLKIYCSKYQLMLSGWTFTAANIDQCWLDEKFL